MTFFTTQLADHAEMAGPKDLFGAKTNDGSNDAASSWYYSEDETVSAFRHVKFILLLLELE